MLGHSEMKQHLGIRGQFCGALLKQFQCAGKTPLPIKDPPKRICNTRIMGMKLPRLARQLAGFFELPVMLGINVGEIIERRTEIRLDGQQMLVSPSRIVKLPPLIVNHPDQHPGHNILRIFFRCFVQRSQGLRLLIRSQVELGQGHIGGIGIRLQFERL